MNRIEIWKKVLSEVSSDITIVLFAMSPFIIASLIVYIPEHIPMVVVPSIIMLIMVYVWMKYDAVRMNDMDYAMKKHDKMMEQVTKAIEKRKG